MGGRRAALSMTEKDSARDLGLPQDLRSTGRATPVTRAIVAVVALLVIRLHDVVAAVRRQLAVRVAGSIVAGVRLVVALFVLGLHDPVAATRTGLAIGSATVVRAGVAVNAAIARLAGVRLENAIAT